MASSDRPIECEVSAMSHHGHSGRGGDGGGVDGGHRGLERIALPARVGEREAGLCEECRAGLGLGLGFAKPYP